ncbi:MAG: type II secretion system GspH family protein [Eubacterium sp.]|nr:type II secretion system GspH family protein [Eubacterium sp.]
MKRHNQKRGFTVVELVVIIAVVAILAAVLIPTYVHLVKKSNEANAQVEAKNLISEMLTDIILGDKDSADLLVFSKKGDDVYLHGYSAEQQRFLSYRNNPIALTTDMEKTVQAAVIKLLAEGVIEQNPDVDNEKNPNDWRLEKNVKTIIETLSTKYDVVVYANYIINADKFAPHVHTWETAWMFDGTHHWHKCAGCDEITGKAEHVYDADGKCVCGAVKTTPTHTHLFDKKNVADKYRKSAADCTHPAVYYFSCACGEVGQLTFEDGTALGHLFGNGNVTTQPTCTSQGIMTYTCTRCGMTKTEAIPARGHTYGANGKCTTCGATKPGQGHTHKYFEVETKKATCTAPAEYQLKCSCGEIGSQTYTKGTALGHAWDAGKITKEPTYVSEGEKTYICTVCGETKVKDLDMKHLDTEPVIIANEGEFKKAFEEAINGGAKTLRVKLTDDLDLAKIGDCVPVFSIGEDEYHTATLVNFNLEIDLNGHNICLNALNTTLTLGNNSKLILRNGTMKGFLCEMEGNAEAYLENVTLNDAGLSLTYAGIGISAETDWLAHIGSAILELNNCKAICTSDNGEERFDITKDKLNKCCSAKAPPFFSDEPKFWAKIFVNEVRAEIYGNQLEY